MAIPDTTAAGSTLGRLNDLDEYKVADGYPDIRGWVVQTPDGRTVGKVGDLIVDTEAMRVRYLDVEVDRSLGELAKDAATPGDQEQHTLLPIGNVQLDEHDDHVTVDGYTLEQIAGLPRYGGRTISRDYESALRNRYRARGTGAAAAGAGAVAAHHIMEALGQDDAKRRAATMDQTAAANVAPTAAEYDSTDYDERRLYAPRYARGDAARTGAAAAGEPRRLTLAEEQLEVGKRAVSAGEVEVRKTVDTRHVHEQVDVSRDEVTVERRPITDASQLDARPLGEGEISIPVMEERLVVEKRLVPVEQIIVRKRQVTDQQTVDADLRRERVEIDDASARAAGLVRDAGTSAARTDLRDTNAR